MTEWQRGYRQARRDFWSEWGCLHPFELELEPADFQAGYRTRQNEMEESIDDAAQARIFDR